MRGNLFPTGTFNKYIVLLIVIPFSSLGCDDNPPGPLRPQPGKRNYVWNVDTLFYPGSIQTRMSSLWGTSAKNVYAVGHNDQDQGKMFHYDGKTWKPVRLSFPDNSGNVSMDLNAIYGFSAYNVIAVGRRIYYDPRSSPAFWDSSLIIRFDGVRWSEVEHSRLGALADIWGPAPNALWTVGQDGAALFFDGSHWNPRCIRDEISFTNVGGVSSQDIYVTGYTLDEQPYDSIMSYLCYFDGSLWNITDSFNLSSAPSHRYGVSDIESIPGTTVMLTAGSGIFERRDRGWDRLIAGTSILGLFAYSSNHVFAVGRGIYHHNGTDWLALSEITGLQYYFTSIWADVREVFVLGHDSEVSYIFHGR